MRSPLRRRVALACSRRGLAAAQAGTWCGWPWRRFQSSLVVDDAVMSVWEVAATKIRWFGDVVVLGGRREGVKLNGGLSGVGWLTSVTRCHVAAAYCGGAGDFV